VDEERRAKRDAENRARSIDELIRYLTDRRQKYSQALAALPNETRPVPADARPPASPSELFHLPNEPLTKLEPEQLARVAQVVDTALFRTYLATRPVMIGPLCRIENWCEVEEVEELLLEAKVRFPDFRILRAQASAFPRLHTLITFRSSTEIPRAVGSLQRQEYARKGSRTPQAVRDRLSRSAVMKSTADAEHLTFRMSAEEDDPEEKVGPTVRYLQKLGAEHLAVILDASRWVFAQDTEAGLQVCVFDRTLVRATLLIAYHAVQIFTADLDEVESLPRQRVMTHLESVSRDVCIRYLEHVIHQLGEQGAEFHEKLIDLYLQSLHATAESCTFPRSRRTPSKPSRRDLTNPDPQRATNKSTRNSSTCSNRRRRTAQIVSSADSLPKTCTKRARCSSVDWAATKERCRSTCTSSRTMLRPSSASAPRLPSGEGSN
jgi:hypothetical protein